MAAGNAVGEKPAMFAIGKSKTPRRFKHIKNLPCKYKSQYKSWMESQKSWPNILNGRKKNCTAYCNCPAHPSVSDLTNVQLVFLLPNTTSVLQPMDQSIIRSLKAHYRGRFGRRLCKALDKTKTLPKISILQAMKILVSSRE